MKALKNVSIDRLVETRASLHQAVQLVAACPRNLLPHDPSDATASLIWNNDWLGLESQAFGNERVITSGICFKTFEIFLIEAREITWRLNLNDYAVNQVLIKLKTALEDLGLQSELINLELPYKIPDYNYDAPLQIQEDALGVFATLYDNASLLLSEIISKNEGAHDLKSWPHHFDIATLLPIAHNGHGEMSKSIGIGLSPGDEGIIEPYFYVNVWTEIPIEQLSKHDLKSGQWCTEGWSGANLRYSELLGNDQQSLLDGFIREVTHIIDLEKGG